MDKEILIFAIVGVGLILFGLIIYKGKAYSLISGYEILKWKGVDMDKLAKKIFNGFLFMGICILLIPTTLVYFNFQLYASWSLTLIVIVGIFYVIVAGLRIPKKPSE